MKKKLKITGVFVLMFLLIGVKNLYAEEVNIIKNPGFEKGLLEWSSAWSRDNKIKAFVDQKIKRSEKSSLRLENSSEKDFSFSQGEEVLTNKNEVYEFGMWVKTEGAIKAEISFETLTKNGEVINWTAFISEFSHKSEWTLVKTQAYITSGTAKMIPRVTGSGIGKVWIDDVYLLRKPDVNTTIENSKLKLDFDSSTAVFNVTDKRNNMIWTQEDEENVVVQNIIKKNNQMDIDFNYKPLNKNFKGSFVLNDNSSEVTFYITNSDDFQGEIMYPYHMKNSNESRAVLPLNEGISFSVSDTSVDEMSLPGYSGHGLSMAFFGETYKDKGYMGLVETPDDFSLDIKRYEKRLGMNPKWEDQKQKLGYKRGIRYVYFNNGGIVNMAKYYRDYAKSIGLLKTFEQKRISRPNVDKLIASPNIWSWHSDSYKLIDEMKALGMTRFLWSNGDEIDKVKAMGNLVGSYDNYQDVDDPKNHNASGAKDIYENDTLRDKDQNRLVSWEEKDDFGKVFANNYYLCSYNALKYAVQNISDDLKINPKNAIFLDCVTATGWMECYSPNHPMTRTDDKKAKMRLLEFVSKDKGLVTGSETGIDAAVPYVDYFEGMMSFGPFRVPDSGRNIEKIWLNVPKEVKKYQVGEKYRIPLWELVYHDSIVSYWYWGDASNKLPELWDKKDLFNILYANPPLYVINDSIWSKYKTRFAKSYNKVIPQLMKVKDSEMVDYKVLNSDYTVQQTKFANGAVVTVNFGKNPYKLSTGEVIKSMDFLVKTVKN